MGRNESKKKKVFEEGVVRFNVLEVRQDEDNQVTIGFGKVEVTVDLDKSNFSGEVRTRPIR